MAFFEKYNGSTEAAHLRMERWVAALVYGGLLLLVLGWFMEHRQGADGSMLYGAGALALALGVLQFFRRARQGG